MFASLASSCKSIENRRGPGVQTKEGPAGHEPARPLAYDPLRWVRHDHGRGRLTTAVGWNPRPSRKFLRTAQATPDSPPIGLGGPRGEASATRAVVLNARKVEPCLTQTGIAERQRNALPLETKQRASRKGRANTRGPDITRGWPWTSWPKDHVALEGPWVPH